MTRPQYECKIINIYDHAASIGDNRNLSAVGFRYLNALEWPSSNCRRKGRIEQEADSERSFVRADTCQPQSRTRGPAYIIRPFVIYSPSPLPTTATTGTPSIPSEVSTKYSARVPVLRLTNRCFYPIPRGGWRTHVVARDQGEWPSFDNGCRSLGFRSSGGVDVCAPAVSTVYIPGANGPTSRRSCLGRGWCVGSFQRNSTILSGPFK